MANIAIWSCCIMQKKKYFGVHKMWALKKPPGKICRKESSFVYKGNIKQNFTWIFSVYLSLWAPKRVSTLRWTELLASRLVYRQICRALSGQFSAVIHADQNLRRELRWLAFSVSGKTMEGDSHPFCFNEVYKLSEWKTLRWKSIGTKGLLY
jgi:hypothetical protein